MKWIPSVNEFLDKVKKEDDLKDIDRDIIIRNIRDYIKKIKSEITTCSPTTQSLSCRDSGFVERGERGGLNSELRIPNSELSKDSVLNHFISYVRSLITCPLKPIINATGIVLHTNLGRAPMSDYAFDELKKTTQKYVNIEFDLHTGKRAYRDDYLRDIFYFITGAEDVVVVNNNAAALYLILKTYLLTPLQQDCFGGNSSKEPRNDDDVSNSELRTPNSELSRGCGCCCGKKNYPLKKEVLISRGELIEIGGSFRIPDILQATGAVLKEVGTTNCTRLSDFENAISDNTAMILKAHTSNYTIKGYTESVAISDLVSLAKKYNIPFVYDAGSGLIKKPLSLQKTNEPIISECLEKGVDIICFSGDKLLGSSQAGIILGKENFLKPLKSNPLMRVLRADKLTISNLYHHISMYKSEKDLIKKNKVYNMLSQPDDDLREKATYLSDCLSNLSVKSKIHEVSGYTGGGTMPGLSLISYEIEPILSGCHTPVVQNSVLLVEGDTPPTFMGGVGGGNKSRAIKSEQLYHNLLKLDVPIVGVLRENKFFFNILTIDKEDMPYISESIARLISKFDL